MNIPVAGPRRENVRIAELLKWMVDLPDKAFDMSANLCQHADGTIYGGIAGLTCYIFSLPYFPDPESEAGSYLGLDYKLSRTEKKNKRKFVPVSQSVFELSHWPKDLQELYLTDRKKAVLLRVERVLNTGY